MIFEKTLRNIKRVFWFSLQLLSETFLILRRTERDMVKSLYRSSCKVPVILVRFYWYLSFLGRSLKNIQNSWKCVQWEPNYSTWQTDGQTDMTKLTVAVVNFSKALNKQQSDHHGRAAWDMGLRPFTCWKWGVRIPPGAWMSVSYDCCVLSGRNLWGGPITRPEASYQVWCFWAWSRNLTDKEA
jgi:hypothetical protein